MRLRTLIILVLLICSKTQFAQSLQGFVYDESNNPIPFAKVYVKNFNNLGAVTDTEGKYFFGCDMGTYDVIYKCVGFEDQEVKVTIDKVQPTVQNVWLKQKDNELNTVEVETKKRNVGWEIVQNVISHKKDLIKQFDSYNCEVYIKGVETYETRQEQKNQNQDETDEEPNDKFQKQKDEINNKLNGENRLNLVEINLEKHFQYPNKIKEIRNGYDKLGRPDQIYFQTTTSGEFNFYESLIRKDDLHRTPIVSPLHPAGILNYKYKLKEVIEIENDTIYKVEISPRSVGTSTMEGFLWILKSEWVLTKVDVSMHKGNLKIYDNFRITQDYEKIDSFWVVSKQSFEYDTKYFKEKVHGITTVSYSNWNFNPTYPPKFFNSEIGVTTKEAYERDSTYWDQIRPVPLTPEEQRKKFVQDSLTAIYTSEKYLDSVDAVFNKITWLKALWFGFEHRNREKKEQWYISSVAQLIEPISAGGPRIGPGFQYFKKWEDEQWIDVDGDYSIGVTNWDSRGRLRIYHRYLPKKFGTWSIWGSRETDLINSWNSYLGTLSRSNWYMNNKFGAWHRIEVANGLYVATSARFEHREPFDSTYKFISWFDKWLQQEDPEPYTFNPYNAFRTNLSIQFTPFQKYMTEPNRKVVLGSRWPTLSFYWEKGYRNILKSVVDFDYISFTVDQEFNIGTMGKSYYIVKSGKFVNQDSVFYIDRKFFRKSDSDPFFKYFLSQPLYSFQNLDSSYQTQDFYFELHYIHHFNGALINKIPFMKKTGIQALVGGGTLFLPEHNNYFYMEAYTGIERTFKFMRRRLRIGAYVIFSWANNAFAIPDDQKPKNVQFKVSFDIMNERDLKFNF
ncbi:DUF5686 and carboxypeptidase regulatory-like domain-containing protein [Paracrocinitomix mangrovi]|uniref:DUF5686 and carboxypeptidase regulatory-like domain-containing protein n=1 Tax=Paracrocinitomix mangrovi TaxID=2862509 RepID=UPI001C8DDEF5|nr:DUF5686 and carboxypeptidase regulatory-like domain-containing protein [Paracrocinitomix mangrovi]UKN03547.1 DUF5686 and carboxypeptidase regulatory-like domain-containing protein [Paracrocinitomix mangrovi]